MTTTETLKLALEALEVDPFEMVEDASGHMVFLTNQAITALRKALAEQKSGIKQVIELYDSPDQPAPVAKPHEQEPVAWICEGSSSDEKHAIDYWPGDIEDIPIGTKLYTSPPASKPWVGLTDVEWQEIDASLNGKRDLARIFVRAIEAKLKEKNCG